MIFTMVSLSPALFLISRIWLRRRDKLYQTKTTSNSPEKLYYSSLCLLQSTCSIPTNSRLRSHHLPHLILNRRHLLISHIKSRQIQTLCLACQLCHGVIEPRKRLLRGEKLVDVLHHIKVRLKSLLALACDFLFVH